MKIAIIASGSRGDVQPYIALAHGLQKAGHQVRLVTNDNFKQLVERVGVPFYRMRGNVQEVAESPEIRELLAKGNFFAITMKTAKLLQEVTLQWAEDGLVACAGVDVIVAGIGGIFLGLALAEKLDIPLLQAYVVPLTPTSAFPSVLLPPSVARLGGVANKLSHTLTQQAIWQGVRSADKLARQKVLGLKPAPFFGSFNSKRMCQFPTLYGISPSVLPHPADWGDRAKIMGYWFLDVPSDWQPSEALLAFLEAGERPLYIGFGSMSSRNPEATSALVLEALAMTRQRAVIASGWGGFTQNELPANVFMVDNIPHDWLFPRVSAVVHHGGAGTSAAGMRAGVPSIVIPFFADQTFWGQRIADLGVGVAPMPRAKLTAEKLAQAMITATTNATIVQTASTLGEKIRAENGIANTVTTIEELGL